MRYYGGLAKHYANYVVFFLHLARSLCLSHSAIRRLFMARSLVASCESSYSFAPKPHNVSLVCTALCTVGIFVSPAK